MLEITGEVCDIMEPTTFKSSGSKYESFTQVFAIKTKSRFSKTVAFNVYNEQLNLLDGLHTGTTVKVSFDPESTLSQQHGRYYTNLKCVGIDII